MRNYYFSMQGSGMLHFVIRTLLTLYTSSSSSECSAQGQVLHCKLRNQGRSSAQRQVFHRKLRNQDCSCFPHPILCLASEQTLDIWKDLRDTSVEVRRVDLANWALRMLPKFTTGVKYKFLLGFWPDQRFGNPNHPSPQIFIQGLDKK